MREKKGVDRLVYVLSSDHIFSQDGFALIKQSVIKISFIVYLFIYRPRLLTNSGQGRASVALGSPP